MVLLKSEKTALARLKRAVKGSKIKVKVNDIGNATIFGGGFKPITKQLTTNTGISPLTIAKARVKISKLKVKARI